MSLALSLIFESLITYLSIHYEQRQRVGVCACESGVDGSVQT